ncbi:MAG: sialate O-acetylesterase [Verrucomicrobiota bacterium]
MKKLILTALAALSCQAGAKPLKVFILAGQSNMEGHAKVETFDYIGDDPATAPLLRQMRGPDGKPTVCDQVWISYLTGMGEVNGEGFGKLTAGYGSRQKPDQDGGKIGPEFTFGLTLDKSLDEPVLIIKTAWGGKSLHTDFRPPSAGPYELNDYQRKLYHGPKAHGVPDDMDKWLADKKKETGHYYRLMVEHVKRVLTDPQRVCPVYDEGQGYEIAGFVWLQGWNDMVDGHTYPDRGSPERFAAYSDLLTHFIRDVRKDFSAPEMPFVIGVMGVGGLKASPETISFRKAMTAPSLLAEFKGNVFAVPTAPFWSEELGAIDDKRAQVRQMGFYLNSKNKDHANADGHMTEVQKRAHLQEYEAKLISPAEVALWQRGASNAGYHYLGCAKTFALMGKAFAEALLHPSLPKTAAIQEAEMAGYLFAPAEKVPEEFNGGFSLYAAAWPLVATYPGHMFQTGLCGTWMHPQYEPGKAPAGKCYTDIEGGLGWWRDTHFPTTTPKFIMGGVGPNFSFIANGPGYGAGTWEKPRGQYGVAQLSPWLLFPLDGLNLRQGTSGELFGYGYLPLPLTNAKTTTAGKDLPTGNQCWTLFLNTANFKGPAAFFTPYFWTQATLEHPEWSGMLLDSRPAGPNKAIQMETQHVPAVLARDAAGRQLARVAPTSFPVGPDGTSTVLHRLTAYKKAALWEDVQSWFAGGKPADGAIKSEASVVHTFREGGGSNWSIYPPGTKREQKVPLAWKAFATSFTLNPVTFGYQWNAQLTRTGDSLVTLPEYFALESDGQKKPLWKVMAPQDVPAETGLTQHRFETPPEKPQEPRTTPDDAASCWKKPGPVAGPFKAHLGDGSVVTYYWYRFADQPAMLNADLSPKEREEVQARVEKLHRTWTKDRDYLTPPDVGSLAHLDPALILTPPKGLEVGYVPIATRQELER